MKISELPKIHESQNKDLVAYLIRLPHGTSSIVMAVSMRWSFKINHALGFRYENI